MKRWTIKRRKTVKEIGSEEGKLEVKGKINSKEAKNKDKKYSQE
jgi:hypothetical protein